MALTMPPAAGTLDDMEFRAVADIDGQARTLLSSNKRARVVRRAEHYRAVMARLGIRTSAWNMRIERNHKVRHPEAAS